MESSSSSCDLTAVLEEIQSCARCRESQTAKRRKLEAMTAWDSMEDLQRRVREGAPSPWQVRFLVRCNSDDSCTVEVVVVVYLQLNEVGVHHRWMVRAISLQVALDH